jgi:hypothetical protein
MRHWYPYFGAIVLGGMAYAVFFGWGLTSVDEVKKVPKSVRSNPGVYRSHYSHYSRTYRGK